MCSRHALRVLVTERLTAAAEDIVSLFERTIVEFEEENQRKQRLLDLAVGPRVQLLRADREPLCDRGVRMSSVSPGQKQDIPETPQIKEEPEEFGVKLEEETLPVSVPESRAIWVKREESVLQQRHTQDVSSEPEGHQSEAEGGDGDVMDVQECPICLKTFRSGHDLQIHIGVHTGNSKYTCSFCKQSFSQETAFREHLSSHTGEIRADGVKNKHQCSVCSKFFVRKQTLQIHSRIHTGERPFSCLICKKKFKHRSHLYDHVKTHTGEKPFSCSICAKTFAQKSNLNKHIRAHTGEKPYSCSLCEKAFTRRGNLNQHFLSHRAADPAATLTFKQ